jgi:hypothetical protein
VDENSNWNKDVGEALVMQGEVSSGIRITAVGYNNERFSFNSRGFCYDDSGSIHGDSITLRDSKGRTKNVTIEMTGSSRIN